MRFKLAIMVAVVGPPDGTPCDARAAYVPALSQESSECSSAVAASSMALTSQKLISTFCLHSGVACDKRFQRLRLSCGR